MLYGKQIFLDGNNSGIPVPQRKLLEKIVKDNGGVVTSAVTSESINLVRKDHYKPEAYKNIRHYDLNWLSKRYRMPLKNPL